MLYYSRCIMYFLCLSQMPNVVKRAPEADVDSAMGGM
jgi:hypothetical protein